MKTGETIRWVVVDENGELVSVYATRAQARKAARKAGRIAKVVVAK